MNIGETAQAAGLPAKTIRYYEDIGLVNPLRDSNGYRVFRDNDVHTLAFLGRARSLGFTIEDCRTLMALYQDSDRASSDVKKVAKHHLAHIEAKLKELSSMRDTLTHLVECCSGDARPECPILSDLAAGKGPKVSANGAH